LVFWREKITLNTFYLVRFFPDGEYDDNFVAAGTTTIFPIQNIIITTLLE